MGYSAASSLWKEPAGPWNFPEAGLEAESGGEAAMDC